MMMRNFSIRKEERHCRKRDVAVGDKVRVSGPSIAHDVSRAGELMTQERSSGTTLSSYGFDLRVDFFASSGKYSNRPE